MTKKEMLKEKPLGELKALRQRIAELEAIVAAYDSDEKSNEFDDGQKYRAVFESADDVILLIDKKGKIIDVNKRLKNISGYQQKELIGKNITSLAGMMTEKSFSLVSSNFLKRVFGVNMPPYEVEMIKKNGESIIVEISAQPLKKNDKIIGDLVILRDVTERKQVAEALKTSEENFRNSMDNTLVGFRISDIDNHTLYANQALLDIFGYKDMDELKSTPPHAYYSQDCYADYLKLKERLLRGETTPNQIDIDIVRKDGAIRHLQVLFKEVFWDGKQQYQSVYNDITERKQAEEVLKTSEQTFRNLMDNSTMGVRIRDANDYVVYCNQALLDMFGYENIDELRASPPQDRYTPASYAGYLLRKEKISRGEPVSNKLEVDIIHKDGTIRCLQVFGKPVLWNGETQAQTFYNDITERKQAEDILATSEQNLHNSLDNLPMGFRITDADDNTLYLNQAFLNIFGYENADEVKRRPPLKDFYTPESYADYLRRKERLSHGEPRPDKVEVDIIRKNGALRHLQLSTGELVWNGKKQFQTIYNDVTERKRVEEALKASEEKYSTLIEQSTDGIIILNDRIVEFANKMMFEMTGYSQDEILGKSFPELFTPEYVEFLNERYQRRQAGEKFPDNYELELLTKGNRKIYVETKIQPILYKGRDARMVIIRDITEKKIAAEAMTKIETRYHELVNTITSGVMIFKAVDNGEDFVFMDVNNTAEKMDGINRKDIIGKRVTEVLPDVKDYYWFGVFQRVWRTGNTEYFSSGERENEKDAGRWRDNRAYKLPSGEIVNVYDDITDKKLAEEAVKASEQNFRNSIDSSFMGIYIVDTDWHILYVNQAFLDIFGYENIDEVRASPPHKHYTPEEYARHLVRTGRLLRGEPNPDKFELDIIHKDGAIRHLQVFRKEVLWDGKQQSQLLYNDITDKKLAEEAVKTSEQNFRNSLDNSPMGIRISDLDGHTLYGNSAFLEMFGYENIEEAGANPPHKHYTPEENARFQVRKERELRGEPNPDQFEIDIVRKDGDIRHLQVFVKDVFWNGKQGRQVIYNDTTERIRAEEALKASENSLRNSLDNSPIGIRISDRNDDTLYANQAFLNMFGYENIEELKASPPLKHYTPAAYADFLQRMEQQRDGAPRPDSVEIEIIRKDGNIRHLRLSSRELVWYGQQQFQNLYIDITERKASEEALQESEEKYSTLIEQSIDGILIFKDRLVTFANHRMSEMTGFSQEEILGKYFYQLTAPEYKEMLDDEYRRRQAGEEVSGNHELEILTKDGRKITVETKVRRIVYQEKPAVMSIIRDITERKQAEEALRVSEGKYRLIVENSQDIIFTLDSAGKFIYTSPSIKQMLGYNQTDLIGLPFISLVHPEDRHVIEDAIRLGDEAGNQTTGGNQYRFRHASGEWRWHISRGTHMLDTGGKSFNFIGIANDITERKQAEEDMKASEQNFRNSMDSSLMGIRIMGDADYTLYANQALLDMFGYENIEELRASPPQEHYTPESHAGFIRRKEQFARGELLPDTLEFDIVRKDSAIRRLQLSSKHVLWNGKEQNQILYNDITERKQAEEKLKQAAQEWRTTFDSITDLISIHDKDNRIVRVNKALADMLKTTPNELIGKYCHEVMHGTKEPPANCPHLQTLKTGKPAAIETLNPNLEAYFHESSSPLFNDKGEITGSIIVNRDVTQQKRIEEQLIMTDRLASIGELASGIAHELNNPLTSVIGFSQLLMEGDVPENIKEDLSTVYSEAQRAAAIVKNLLTFARKHAPVKQLCQVNTIIEDVLRLRTYEQKANNIEVGKHLGVNLPGIMIDYFQMQQAFLNIIVNAEFAMLEAHHKGKLSITTEKIDGYIRISFADDGPGILEENLKHIFDPFFTTKEVGKGTGLGLSICHGVVTEHRGKIYARNENGQGATFIIELPVDG